MSLQDELNHLRAKRSYRDPQFGLPVTVSDLVGRDKILVVNVDPRSLIVHPRMHMEMKYVYGPKPIDLDAWFAEAMGHVLQETNRKFDILERAL